MFISEAVRGVLRGLIDGFVGIWEKIWKRHKEKTNEYLEAEVKGYKRGNAALRARLRLHEPRLRVKKGAPDLPSGDSDS